MTYVTNLAVAGLSLVSVIITARVLGPDGRGTVVLMTTIAMLVANLAMFGFHEANANIGASEPRQRRALATNSIFHALLFGLAAFGLISILIAMFPLLGGGASLGLRSLAFLAIPILLLQWGLQTLIQSQYGFGATNLAWLAAPVTNVAVNGILAVTGVLSVTTAVAAWVVGQILSTCILIWYTARRGAGFGGADISLARRSLAYGSRTHLGRIMTLGNYRIDGWLVAAIAGTRELGLYSVAVAWAETLFFLPTVLSMVQRPDLVRASKRDAAARAGAIFRGAALLTSAVAVGLVVAAPFLCTVVFGDDFDESVGDLRILALGGFGVVALKLLGSALNAQRKPMHANIGVGVAFFMTIVLDVALIPTFGGEGAALASTIAYTLGGLTIAVVFLRVLDAPRETLVPGARDLRALRSHLRRG